MIRMLAKGRMLTTYETGPQFQTSFQSDMPLPYVTNLNLDDELALSPRFDVVPISFSERSGGSPPSRSELQGSIQDGNRSMDLPLPYIPNLNSDVELALFPRFDIVPFTFSERSEGSPPPRSDFQGSIQEKDRSLDLPPKAPPDNNRSGGSFSIVRYLLRYLLCWPWRVLRRLWARFQT